MALVAAAGPATNFLLALGWPRRVPRPRTSRRHLVDVAVQAFTVNIVLGIFNLIPIPPLDGSRIVGASCPDRAYASWSALDQYGMFVALRRDHPLPEEFFTLMDDVRRETAQFMIAIVGG